MKTIRVVLATCILAMAAWGQQALPSASATTKNSHPSKISQGGAPVVRDATFQSAALGREMHYRILLPADYETSSRRYPVLYLLHGLTGHYEDWESRTHLDDYETGLPLIVAMPEGGDSWYTNSASEPQEKWEDYIIKDFIPYVDKTYRTIQTRHARAVAGLSMGGYGAMKFALKFPGTFVFAASMSGAQFAVHDPDAKIPFGQKYTDQLHNIFGTGVTPTRTDNDVFELAKKRTPAQAPYLMVTCGTEDGLLASNREFVALLQQQKLRYEYHESAGAHTWMYWDEQLPGMLSLLMERFFQPPQLRKLPLPQPKQK
jgi:S-formylglutathione hydrolase FrmB